MKSFAERIIDTIVRYAPGIREQIIHRELLTPLVLEQGFNVTGGHWHHTEFALDQALMMRPTYEAAALIGTNAYIGALMNMGNGHLQPLNLCLGEARAAISRDATIYEQSPVLRIEHGSKPCVISAEGSVTADMVVIADKRLLFGGCCNY